MSFKPISSLRRGIGALWRGLDATRRFVLNLIFLIILIAFFWAMFGGGLKPLAPKTALVLDLKGELVEERAGSVRDSVVAGLSGNGRRLVRLPDVLKALDGAAKDNNVNEVLVLLDELDGGGLASVREIGAGIERVKAAGKRVVVWGGNFDQKRYLIAAHASEIYLHPMGMVLIEGFGRHRNYYRDALDKVGVTVNLMKVGTYKSFAEPFIGNGPSQAAQEADSFLYNGLWTAYTAEVEKARKLPAGAIAKGIDELPQRLQAANGNAAKVALDWKLIDGVKTRDEVRAEFIKRGAYDDRIKSFRQVSFGDYVARHPDKPFGDAVAVVVAAGDITEGTGGPGMVGGISTANLIRSVREDSSVKAVVLRVNSPGGSAYGSELIRRELELTRAAGKPVVVSMGDVAASGGYWISMAADEVIADPSTVTGSIGVFAILPTADKVVDKLGIHTAGVTTTWLADAYNPLRPLDPRFGQLIQSAINHVYDEFTTKAAVARKTTPAKIDEVGQGRVWTGTQAKERGLVDRLGSYGDALRSAAKRANLGDDFRVTYAEQPTTFAERVLERMGLSDAQILNVQVKLGLLPVDLGAAALGGNATAGITRDLGWLSAVADRKQPFAAVTHCLCALP
ncbi:signal peptide peptidase SppA [Telluria mixta]|uniref:Signal peptide peptidase SppA n=1 Tax=Telluria mixta TaxID=34071 RepID=A0ABT2BTV8_9BURK|nr:signal peptide peptidase SppA [Telluria mixta]MCS0628412.1 signal peptide peptidase SppA [Telluria mixta]WEM93481.1 signal peptide peptidase SppA [Telluria mixta]